MPDFVVVEAAIRQVHAHYADAVWRKDVKAFGECFAQDAEWRLSGMTLKGRRQITAFMAGVFPKYRRILLTFRTPLIDLDGEDRASARTYVTEQSVLADGRTYGPIGTYYERFIQTGGHWKFAWRLFMTDYIGPPDLSGTLFENPDFGPPPAMPSIDQPSFDRSGILTGNDDRHPGQAE